MWFLALILSYCASFGLLVGITLHSPNWGVVAFMAMWGYFLGIGPNKK